MSYAQWIAIKIVSENTTLTIKNARLSWGKFHKEGNKDAEISPSEINGVEVRSGESFSIFSCGRSNSASGTRGSFELYDRNIRVGIFDWNSPWGIKRNSFNWWPDASKDSYLVQIDGGNRDSGAIGNVTIVVLKR